MFPFLKSYRNINYRIVFCSALLFISVCCSTKKSKSIVDTNRLKEYIDNFNQNDNETRIQFIPNDSAFNFLLENIPLIDIPDKKIEETYYFRWWTFRKHIRQTDNGFVFTEFLPEVSWSGKYNTISCAGAHHIYEGRWLKNPEYVNDYINFWLTESGKDIRKYSFWIADAAIAFHSVHRNDKILSEKLPCFVKNFNEWEKIRKDTAKILFWQIDTKDGMEFSASGRILNNGKIKHHKAAVRPSINSYMYGEANAISKIAQITGNQPLKTKFALYAKTLKREIQKHLWNKDLNFFTVLPRQYTDTTSTVNVRELIGYTPWYFNLPDDNPEYAKAWEVLIDTTGFYAPYGLTTCEQSHPFFQISYTGFECQWNGPSWPYSTTITLKALSNFLNNYKNTGSITKNDYNKLLAQYAESHFLIKESGDTIKWIDECLNPYNGDWITRTILKKWEESNLKEQIGGNERGKDYNHSSFCDLVISDLLGIKPYMDGTIEINPLVSDNWEWFCIENIWIQNKNISVVWDKTGEKYKIGQGLLIFIDGKQIVKKERIQKIIIRKNKEEVNNIKK